MQTKMYQAIHEQPGVARDVLSRVDAGARTAADLLRSSRRVFLMGSGTSFHAAIVGEHLLRLAGADAYATTNYDFSVYPRPLDAGDAVIAISHRGGKRYGNEVVARVQAAGARLIGVTGQDTKMEGPQVSLQTAPQEVCSANTVSYTANLVALAQIAVHLGEANGRDVAALKHDLQTVPDVIQGMLEFDTVVRRVAARLATSRRAVLIGAGPNAATAREGALKLKETCYLVAEGFELETWLHGGLPSVARDDLAIVIVAEGPSVDRLRDAARALQLVGADLLVIADERAVARFFADDVLKRPDDILVFPAQHEALSPIAAVIPLQSLANYTSAIVGTDPDNFREEDPIYKAAVDSYTF